MTQVRDFARGDKGRVYVIGCQVGCKIGWTSKDPAERVRALQTGNPYPLHLVGSVEGTVEMERDAHARFEDYRMAGEWFRVNPFDALMWLTYETGCSREFMKMRLEHPFEPQGCMHGILHALDAYGHGPTAIWTPLGLNAAIGRWPSEEELDDLLFDKKLFRARVTVGARVVDLFSVTPFGEPEETPDPFDA